MNSLHEEIGDIWPKRHPSRNPEGRLHWAGSRTIIDYVARIICNEACLDVESANITLLRGICSRLQYTRGISVSLV